MRIGFRVGQFPKLSETFIVSQIEGMVERGHDVTVLADGMPDQQEIEALNETAGVGAKIEYVRPCSRTLARIFDRLPHRIRHGRAVAAERRLCRSSDVVVCNFGWFGEGIAINVPSPPRHARLLTIFHGADVSRDLENGSAPYRALFSEGDLHLTVNRLWARKLAECGAPRDKIELHYLGVDLDRFPFRQRADSQGRPFLFITVCRLVEKKGIEFALRALALLNAKPGSVLVYEIYGDGPLRPDLEQLRDALGLRDKVFFRGHIPHAEVAARLADADAFLLPSVVAEDGDMEGLPIVLMEAMAAGLPVVSTFHSGIPELVEHGINGLLAAERDVRGLSEQLVRVMSEGTELAKAARRTIEDRFDLRSSNDRLEVLIRTLADAPSRHVRETVL